MINSKEKHMGWGLDYKHSSLWNGKKIIPYFEGSSNRNLNMLLCGHCKLSFSDDVQFSLVFVVNMQFANFSDFRHGGIGKLIIPLVSPMYIYFQNITQTSCMNLFNRISDEQLHIFSKYHRAALTCFTSTLTSTLHSPKVFLEW